MRIAFFTDTWLPNIDGVVSALTTTIPELTKRGHKCIVYTPSPNFKNAKTRFAGAPIYLYRSTPFPPYPTYRVTLPSLSLLRTFRNLKHWRPQIIHNHAIITGLLALKAARSLRIPSIATFHTMFPLATHYLVKRKWSKALTQRLVWRAIKAFYSQFDAVIAPSNVIAETLSAKGLTNILVVPSGIDTQRFKPLPKKQQTVAKELITSSLGIAQDGDGKLLLHVGRLVKEKNIDVLLRAMRALLNQKASGSPNMPNAPGARNMHLLMIGDGPARQKFEALAKRLGISKNVHFLGLRATELPIYYAACDAFVTPSTFETQGLAVLEAMACGKIVIAAKALALSEIVQDGCNGLAFEPFNAKQLAQKISHALELSNGEAQRLCKAARRTAEHYSIKATVDALLKAYSQVLEKSYRFEAQSRGLQLFKTLPSLKRLIAAMRKKS